MADHKLDISDETQAASQVNPAAAEAPRLKYEVAVQGGIFKNGKAYRRGSKVELDAVTAERAIAAGDIKPLSTKGN